MFVLCVYYMFCFSDGFFSGVVRVYTGTVLLVVQFSQSVCLGESNTGGHLSL